MNRSMIRYLLGGVLKIEAVLLVLPILIALLHSERSECVIFAGIGVCSFAI